MPKNPNKHYSPHGYLRFFVNGLDDWRAHNESELKNIEAGSWVHGVLYVHSPICPPDPNFAFAKFKIQGKHNVLVIKTEHYETQEGETRTRQSRYNKTKKWMKRKEKVVCQLIPAMSKLDCPDAQGNLVMAYLYSFFVHPEWCDSFHKNGAFCSYELKLKVKYPGIDLKFKVTRKIDIMQRRPTLEEIHRHIPVDTESHRSLTGGSVNATISVDAGCFIEGTQATFTATIENNMDRPIMEGKLELEEEITTTEKHKNDRRSKRYTTNTRTRDIVQNKLMGLEIPPNSTKTIVFAVDIPRHIEPPTTGFREGHHVCNVDHYLRLVLCVPWGVDCRTRFRVRIVPDPARYALIEPLVFQIPGQPPMFGTPPGYQVVPTQPQAPVRWDYNGKILLQFELVRAEGLPKMDFTFRSKGGADPFVTMYVNDLHVRTSEVVHNTRNPQFDQHYRVYLDEGHDLRSGVDNITFKFLCYDYDRTSKNDKIGQGSFLLDAENCDELVGDEHPEFQVPLSYDHPKKGLLENRGVITARVLYYGPAFVVPQ